MVAVEQASSDLFDIDLTAGGPNIWGFNNTIGGWDTLDTRVRFFRELPLDRRQIRRELYFAGYSQPEIAQTEEKDGHIPTRAAISLSVGEVVRPPGIVDLRSVFPAKGAGWRMDDAVVVARDFASYVTTAEISSRTGSPSMILEKKRLVLIELGFPIPILPIVNYPRSSEMSRVLTWSQLTHDYDSLGNAYRRVTGRKLQHDRVHVLFSNLSARGVDVVRRPKGKQFYYYIIRGGEEYLKEGEVLLEDQDSILARRVLGFIARGNMVSLPRSFLPELHKWLGDLLRPSSRILTIEEICQYFTRGLNELERVSRKPQSLRGWDEQTLGLWQKTRVLMETYHNNRGLLTTHLRAGLRRVERNFIDDSA